MPIEKVIMELNGVTCEYRLVIKGDYDTLWALREELVQRMTAQHNRFRGADASSEGARTNPELVALIVARLCEFEGRPPDGRRISKELRKMGLEAVSYSLTTYLKRAEKAGLVRRSIGGWVPAEGLAARFAGATDAVCTAKR